MHQSLFLTTMHWRTSGGGSLVLSSTWGRESEMSNRPLCPFEHDCCVLDVLCRSRWWWLELCLLCSFQSSPFGCICWAEHWLPLTAFACFFYDLLAGGTVPQVLKKEWMPLELRRAFVAFDMLGAKNLLWNRCGDFACTISRDSMLLRLCMKSEWFTYLGTWHLFGGFGHAYYPILHVSCKHIPCFRLDSFDPHKAILPTCRLSWWTYASRCMASTWSWTEAARSSSQR